MKAHQIDIVHGFMMKSSLVASAMAIMANPKVVLVSRRSLGYDYNWRAVCISRMLTRFATRFWQIQKQRRMPYEKRVGQQLTELTYSTTVSICAASDHNSGNRRQMCAPAR